MPEKRPKPPKIKYNELYSFDSDINDNSCGIGKDDDSLEQQKDRYKQNTRHRSLLSKWVVWVVSIWLGLVMFLLLFNILIGIKLSDEVIITLLTTTTINILGLPLIILRSLFKD